MNFIFGIALVLGLGWLYIVSNDSQTDHAWIRTEGEKKVGPATENEQAACDLNPGLRAPLLIGPSLS